MIRTLRVEYRALAAGATWAFLCLSAGCASQRSHLLVRSPACSAGGDYAVLAGDESPFRIDVEQPRPFSKWNVPWDDNNIVGLDIVWLKRPAGCSEFPEFALVINEYTNAEGLACLVDREGTIRASIRDLGLIQKISVVDIAPIREPQILVYTSPDHGTGARSGRAVLLAVSGAETRVLLSTPRYDYFALQGDNYSFGLPILVGKVGHDTRIVFPLFRFVLREESPDASALPVARADWEYSEYEWDDGQRVFRPAKSPAFRCVFSPDAWTWSPQYDVGGKGYVLNRQVVTPLPAPRPAPR